MLKHGTLTTSFIGLAECLVALTGQHHGQSPRPSAWVWKSLGHMRSLRPHLRERGMNYTLIATPAEGLSGRFVRMDRACYGVIPGVTDRDYYTNGFHVPVYFDISAFDKIALEAPYHALTNGGHISYIELDGDPSDNLEAFESVIRYMKDCGMGYGSVNHPVDRDPVCGYNGIIEDVCPKCGRTEDAHNQPFERIRRIGYLVGTLDRFNDAKRAEEHDRVKHDAGSRVEHRPERRVPSTLLPEHLRPSFGIRTPRGPSQRRPLFVFSHSKCHFHPEMVDPFGGHCAFLPSTGIFLPLQARNGRGVPPCRPFLPSTGIVSGKSENGICEDGTTEGSSACCSDMFLAEAGGG